MPDLVKPPKKPGGRFAIYGFLSLLFGMGSFAKAVADGMGGTIIPICGIFIGGLLALIFGVAASLRGMRVRGIALCVLGIALCALPLVVLMAVAKGYAVMGGGG